MITTMLNNNSQSTFSTTSIIQRGWRTNRLLTGFIAANIVLAALGMAAMLIDPRTLNGQSVWTKPIKFGLSNAIYVGTILLLLGSVQPRPRWVNWFFNLTGAMLVPGLIVVTMQAARGVRSHYNFATPFDTAAVSIMGLSTLMLSLVSLLACILLLRQPLQQDGLSRSFLWSIKLGVLVTVLVGFGVGSLMLLPSDTQMEMMQAGADGAGSIIGAHTVGAEDGGPGLPLLGWSTTHGDLRPAHFFGLHALQVIPLLGLLVSRRREGWLSEEHRMTLNVFAAAGYTGFIALLTWQALRSESLIYPSATTLTGLALLVGGTLAAIALTIVHARRSN